MDGFYKFMNWLQVNYIDWLLLLFGTGFLLIMGALCFLLWWKMWKETIKLDSLLAEVNGQASMSRFQLLVFTLVVAAGLFMYLLKYVSFPDIPPSVLYLVGISATTYGAGKAITYSRDEGVTTVDERADKRDSELEIHKVNAQAVTNAAVANAAAAANVAESNANAAAANADAVANANAGPLADAAAEGAFQGAVAGVQAVNADSADIAEAAPVDPGTKGKP